MADEPTIEIACICCGNRPPHTPPACDLCRQRLAARLWELRDLHALLGAALAPGQNGSSRISGSKEAPLPLRADALDLAARAQHGTVTDTMVPAVTVSVDFEPAAAFFDSHAIVQMVKERQLLFDEHGNVVMRRAGDQTGHQSVATLLWSWTRDWADAREMSYPTPTVDSLVSWLSRQLPWAFANHPAIDEFDDEIRTTLYAVRALLNVSRAPLYLSDACSSCGVAALRREPGVDQWECANCWATVPVRQLTEDEPTSTCA